MTVANRIASSADDGHPAPSRGRVRMASLWFGVCAAPAAWGLQTLINLSIAAHWCFPALYPLRAPFSNGLRALVFGISLLALTVCIVATFVAWSAWRSTRNEHQQHSGAASGCDPGSALLETGEGRTRFMAFAGVLSSATFVVACAAHAGSIWLVAPCSQ